MAQFSQYVDLRDKELFFALAHAPIINLLPNKNLTVRDSADLMHFPETSLANLLDHVIFGRMRGLPCYVRLV